MYNITKNTFRKSSILAAFLQMVEFADLYVSIQITAKFFDWMFWCTS